MKILPCPWGCTPVVYWNCQTPVKVKCKKHTKIAMMIADWNERMTEEKLMLFAREAEETKP